MTENRIVAFALLAATMQRRRAGARTVISAMTALFER